MVHDGTAACRLTEDGDASFVSSKQMYVILNPPEGKSLIIKSGVEHTLFRLERLSREEAERTQSIIESHIDHTIRPTGLTAVNEALG